MVNSNHLNVILITVDSLRADFIGCCNSQSKHLDFTPNLDRFANKSIAFENAVTHAPCTWDSFPSLFTSKYPRVAALFAQKRLDVTGHSRSMLRNENPTMAEIFKENGYTTAGFHSNPWLVSTFKYNRGFDIFDDAIYPSNTNLILKKLPIVRHDLIHILGKKSCLTAPLINRKAITWLKQVSKPFFLWVHYMDAHGPYQPKEGLAYLNNLRAELLWHKATRFPDRVRPRERKILISWYKEEIAYVDEYIGMLFKVLEEFNLYNDSIIIITSDHGEAFGEHKDFSHVRRLLYDEFIRVPLMITIPDIKEKKIISHPVGLLDILPTLVDIAGIELRDYQFDGNSLLSLIDNGEDNHLPDYVVSDATANRKNDYMSVRTNKWKYILNEAIGKSELYDLENDPDEQINLINNDAIVAKELNSKLMRVYPKLKSDHKNGEIPELTNELEERLRALGYF